MTLGDIMPHKPVFLPYIACREGQTQSAICTPLPQNMVLNVTNKLSQIEIWRHFFPFATHRCILAQDIATLSKLTSFENSIGELLTMLIITVSKSNASLSNRSLTPCEYLIFSFIWGLSLTLSH